jgi:hypothetical protein
VAAHGADWLPLPSEQAGFVPPSSSCAGWAREVPAEWRQQLMVLKAEEGLAEKEGEAEDSERGPETRNTCSQPQEPKQREMSPPPRPGPAGPRAGSRRARLPPSGGAGVQEHQASTTATADSPIDWGWLVNWGQPHRS